MRMEEEEDEEEEEEDDHDDDGNRGGTETGILPPDTLRLDQKKDALEDRRPTLPPLLLVDGRVLCMHHVEGSRGIRHLRLCQHRIHRQNVQTESTTSHAPPVSLQGGSRQRKKDRVRNASLSRVKEEGHVPAPASVPVSFASHSLSLSLSLDLFLSSLCKSAFAASPSWLDDQESRRPGRLVGTRKKNRPQKSTIPPGCGRVCSIRSSDLFFPSSCTGWLCSVVCCVFSLSVFHSFILSALCQ